MKRLAFIRRPKNNEELESSTYLPQDFLNILEAFDEKRGLFGCFDSLRHQQSAWSRTGMERKGARQFGGPVPGQSRAAGVGL
jgi:hypothetical protein